MSVMITLIEKKLEFQYEYEQSFITATKSNKFEFQNQNTMIGYIYIMFE